MISSASGGNMPLCRKGFASTKSGILAGAEAMKWRNGH
jgi:hypothetical protein